MQPCRLWRPQSTARCASADLGQAERGQAIRLSALQASNISWQAGAVSRQSKERLLCQHSCVVWFTGLSGAGKSTVACALEHALHQRGVLTALLDGDNVRSGTLLLTLRVLRSCGRQAELHRAERPAGQERES